jgi:hypothetical protein
MITVADLKDQSGPGQHPVLYCIYCGGRYSANRGDYFMHPAAHVFTCCGEPMELVRIETRYVVVNPNE